MSLTDSFNAMIAKRAAQWRPATEVLRALRRMRRSGWNWGRNFRCKYIDVRIDTRSGRCFVMDRDGKFITLDQLAWQYSKETPEPPVGQE